MPLTPRGQAELDEFLRDAPETVEVPSVTEAAPFGTQVVRGSVKGITGGFAHPMQEAGPGGWPETLAAIVASVVPWTLSARGAGLGVALLGRLFPKLLASGVPPDKAMELLRQLRFGPIREALSGGGRTLALGAGGAGLAGAEALAPEITGAPPRTTSEILTSVGTGAGLGALGGALMRGRGAAKAVETTPAATLSPLGREGVARLLPEEVVPPPLQRPSVLPRSEAGRLPTEVAEKLERGVDDLAQYLRGPESGLSREAAEIQIQRMTELTRSWKPIVRDQIGIEPRSPDTGHVAKGVALFGRFLGQKGQEFELESLGQSAVLAAERISRLPADVDVAVRAATHHQFPSLIAGGSDVPELARTILGRSEIDPNRLVPGGYSQSWLVKFLGNRLGLITLRHLLHGTPAEDLPLELARVDADVKPIVQAVLDASGAAPSLSWSSSTKSSFMRLFYDHMRGVPSEVDAMVLREAPEAAEHLPNVRKMFETIRQKYVENGVLRPEQKFNNYWPVVRERLYPIVEQNRIRLVEKGEGYFPQTLRNRIGRGDVVFAKKRVIQDPEDFPAKMSFNDTMLLYLTQYARHQSLRNHRDEINRLLDGVPPELQDRVANQLGVWLGVPGKEGAFPVLDDISKLVRNVQFMRTIGGSILSPIVNTFQRANTLALVRLSAFTQAFRDAGDPVRLALLEQSAFGRELLLAKKGGGFAEALRKVGIDEMVGPGRMEGWSQWLAEKSGRLFSRSERGNQIHAFLAGLREAEALGIPTGPQQIRFAETILKDSQFIHSPADMPLAFINSSGHPRMIAQFQTFRANQFRFMLRLVEGAQHGMTDFLRTGNPQALRQVMPLVKFVGVSGALGGGTGLLLPDLLEEKLTRAWLGKAMAIPGVPNLIGLSLSNQLGLGTVGIEDLDSMMFYLPGPAANQFQGLMGSILGRSFGRGLDTSDFGRELSVDERTRMAVQSAPLPGAMQANRLIQMLRLVESDGEYRQALDPLEAIGLSRPSGELLSRYTATMIQMLGALVGIQASDRGLERRGLEQQESMERAFNRTVGRAATLLSQGRQAQAERMLARFQASWGDLLKERGALPVGIHTLSPASMRAAAERQMLPPGLRKRLPVALRGTRSEFVEPYASLLSELVPEE